MKPKALFVTGTGTDVGKTYISALIVKTLREAGLNAGYYKAALSGAERVNEKLIPGDAAAVARAAALTADPSSMVSYCYETAVSPHLAAKLEGNPVEMDQIRADFQKLSSQYDYLLMEGSGGIVCPIRYDDSCRILLEDVIHTLGLSSLIVADAGLGTLNATVLTIRSMRQNNLPVSGIFFNRFLAGDVMHEDNRRMVPALCGIDVSCCVEPDARRLAIGAEELAALFREINV